MNASFLISFLDFDYFLQKILKNLNALGFVSRLNSNGTFDSVVKRRDRWAQADEEELEREEIQQTNLIATMTAFQSYGPLPKLKSFRMQNIRAGKSELKELFLDFLVANKNSLEKLYADAELWSIWSMHKQTFPKLKFLKADFGHESRLFGMFINSHPPIETVIFTNMAESSFEIGRVGCMSGPQPGNGYFLFRMIGLKVEKIKQLELCFNRDDFLCKYYPEEKQLMEAPLKWEFLNSAKLLEKLRISFREHPNRYSPMPRNVTAFYSDVSSIFEYLPSKISPPSLVPFN